MNINEEKSNNIFDFEVEGYNDSNCLFFNLSLKGMDFKLFIEKMITMYEKILSSARIPQNTYNYKIIDDKLLLLKRSIYQADLKRLKTKL